MRDDRRWYENEASAEQRRMFARFHSTGSDFDRKFWIAIGLYVVLAVLAWFTVGEGTIFIEGKPVELRLFPLIIIGGMALKTVLARHAEKIRRDGGKSS